ncbi:hypothetical protein C6990_04335 [Nitrosopumilus sp. b3]|nr:hypothetical protein C6990_04335 [Nitrosopumilus sp. b3]
MLCGSSLFEVGTNNTQHEKTSGSINQLRIGLKIPMIVGIPVLILVIIGGTYGLGYFDNVVEKDNLAEPKVIPSKVEQSKETSHSPTSSDSKCGPGTIFDSESNSCVLDDGVDSEKINSKCGPGTIFDSESNSCVLEG